MFELADAARGMRTYFDQRAREHGMTRAQWSVLARLERMEGATQAELAEILEIQPISLVRLIDRLCSQNLLERRAHPTDRRANLLHLTDEGRQALARMVPVGREIAAEALAPLSEAEARQFLEKLVAIKKSIKSAAARHASGAPARSAGNAEAR